MTGADAHRPAKMEDAVAKRIPPSSVNVLTAGLDVTVTSPGSPVKQLLDREVNVQPMTAFEPKACVNVVTRSSK